jgi:ferredoxin
MEFTITLLSQDRQFPCQPGETILNAAIRSNVNISYGCRQGLCGSCLGSLVKGQSHYISKPIAAQGLSGNQLLFCQAIPLTNVTIEMARSRSDNNDEVKTVSARIKTVQYLEQYISLGLQISVNDEIEIGSSDGFIIFSNSAKYWIVVQEIIKTNNISNIKFEQTFDVKKAGFKSNNLIKLQGPYRSFS